MKRKWPQEHGTHRAYKSAYHAGKVVGKYLAKVYNRRLRAYPQVGKQRVVPHRTWSQTGSTLRVKNWKRKASLKNATVRGKYNRRVHFKKRSVRVGKKFRRKVKHVLWSSRPKGFHHVTTFEVIDPSLAGMNNQVCYQLPQSQGLSDAGLGSTYGGGWHFTPTQVLGITSQLFNGATLTGSGANYFNTVADTGNLPAHSVKIPVVKSWVKYCIKNNHDRDMWVKFFICKPKGVDLIKNADGSLNTPYADFARAISLEQLQDDGKFQLQDVTASQTTNTLYQDPRNWPYFNERWVVECVKYNILPGQCIEHIVKGPQDTLYDYNKLYRSLALPNTVANVLDYHPLSRCVMITAYNGLANYSSAAGYSAGRPPIPGATLGQSLIVECNSYYKIACPDEILRKTEAAYVASGNILASNRRDTCSRFVGTTASLGVVYNTQNSGVANFSA